MGKKGVTLVEVLAVIVILGVIATIAVVSIGNLIKNSRLKADIENVNILNRATYYYSLSEDIDLFLSIEGDEEKIQFLVDEGYLNKAVSAASNNADFVWSDYSNYWLYTMYDLADEFINELDINSFNIDEYEHIGDWDSLDGNIYSDSGLLYIDNPRLEYTITVSATIEEGTYGGYGIMFDTFLIDGEDTGFILQMDRGYGRGTVLIRPRKNGDEQDTIQSFRFDHSNSFIPDKNTEEGSLWWSSEHEVEMSVILIEGEIYTKRLTVTIDGQVLFNDFEYETNVGSMNNFTGLRTWSGVEVEFHSFSID